MILLVNVSSLSDRNGQKNNKEFSVLKCMSSKFSKIISLVCMYCVLESHTILIWD